MPALPMSTRVKAGTPYYRITSQKLSSTNPALHINVVNGRGAFSNSVGARYNHPHQVTVYLADDPETCLAEKMFYFHRETVRLLDRSHLLGGVIPPFNNIFVLWEIVFANDVGNVFDLPNHFIHFSVFPT